MNAPNGGKLVDEQIPVTKIYDNRSSEVIKITVDKLRLIHVEYLRDMEKKKNWIAPLGILLTLIITFVTTDFKKAVFQASTWQAFFIMAIVLTIGWLVVALVQAARSKTVDGLIETIKQSRSIDK